MAHIVYKSSTSSALPSRSAYFHICANASATFVLARIVLNVLSNYDLYVQIYEPRVYIPPEARRSPAIHKGFFGWFWTIIRANPSEAIDKIGGPPLGC